ncbi:hypothetical protein D9M68_983630 [compost metagenome]
MLVPSATQLTVMNCACMSVGKPGYSVVRKLCAFMRPEARMRMKGPAALAPASISAPASVSLSITASRCSARPQRSSTSPPVAATAHRKVPASMRSATTW